jgi:murein DD-endopeptidase MepM/ murein hydrolase activator NlpD
MPRPDDHSRACGATTRHRITPERQPTEGERLQRRNVRAWVAAVLLGTLLIPAVGSMAGTRASKLHHIEHQRQHLQDVISRGTAHAATLRHRINVLNRAMARLQLQINTLDAHITRVQSQVETAQAHIDATQSQIDRIQQLARAQAVMLYKTGGTQTLNTLLNSRTLTQLDDRVELLGVAASQNTTALVRYGRLQAQLQSENQVLFERREELRKERAAQQKSLDQRSELRSRVARDLGRLNGKIKGDRDKEKGLATQEKHIKIVIAQAQAKSAVTVLGISSQGFIWPLNGPVTSPFGPRWGSFHPGLDIGGFTGEPFVAAKEGRVIYASWMDGYGNATMIDVGGGIVTLYGHQSRLGVTVGQTVKQGQVIGYVGCTGYCTGPHLHFEVRVNGSAVDPMQFLP